MKKLILLCMAAIAGTFFTNRFSPGYSVGDIVKDFEAKNIDGKVVGLNQFPDAEGYVIVFTCNSCPVAQAYEDRIIRLAASLDDQKWPLIAINSNDKNMAPIDSYDNMKERAKKKKYAFPYIYDESQAILNQFGATKTPHFYLLDKTKKVRYIGALDDNSGDDKSVTKKYVEDAIAAIKAGRDPNPTFTRAVGCSIKKRTT